MFVKRLNAGQICTTVDHVYVPQGKTAEFVAAAREIVARRYLQLDSPDYTAIIDLRAFERLTRTLERTPVHVAALRKICQSIPGVPHPVIGLISERL